MSYKFSLLFLVALSINSFGQSKVVIQDKETKEPVPYVNIAIADEKIEFNADENGFFTLPETDPSKTIYFSAVGYDKLSLQVLEIKDTIFLDPKPIALNEVVIGSGKKANSVVINPIKKAKKKWYAAGGGMGSTLMSARYFPFKEEYTTTPFLNKVKFRVNAEKEYTFNIRLCSVNADGSPGDYLYGENILVTVDKKEKYVEVDFSKIAVRIPKAGLFIVMEHLAIKPNRLTILGDDDSFPPHMYAYGPVTLYEATETKEGWTYKNGTWMPNAKTKNGYPKMAMEVTLTD